MGDGDGIGIGMVTAGPVPVPVSHGIRGNPRFRLHSFATRGTPAEISLWHKAP